MASVPKSFYMRALTEEGWECRIIEDFPVQVRVVRGRIVEAFTGAPLTIDEAWIGRPPWHWVAA